MSLTNAVQSPAMSQTVFDQLGIEEQRTIVEASAEGQTLEGYTGLVVKQTATQALDFFKSMRRGAQFLTVETVTKPDMTSTNNPHRAAMKTSVFNAVAAINWGAAIDRLLKRVGGESDHYEVEALRRNGLKRVTDKVSTKTLKKDGSVQFYIDLFPIRYSSTIFVDNGAVIDKSALAPFLRVKKQRKLDRYGLTEERMAERGISLPRFLSPRITNIRRYKVGGVVYEILK